MSTFANIIQVTSILAILVPLSVGISKFKTAGFGIRLFTFFLLIGFCTDISMFYLQRTGQTTYLPLIFNSYSLIESLVFYRIIIKNTGSKRIRLAVWLMICIAPLLWITVVFILPPSAFYETPSRWFDLFYEVTAALLSALVLLELIEKEPIIETLPDFWILLGLFFYCFCTFFIMGLLNTFLSQRIWFLNNIINVITYVLYSIGLLNYTKK